MEELAKELAKEKSLQREAAETILADQTPTPFADLDKEVQLAVVSASDKKAFNIVALDLRQVTSFAEYFVIASGANQRQVQAISDEINEQLRDQLKARPLRVEGHAAGEWVLLDYGDFIIHIFEQKAREFYDLERLWRDARKVEIPEGI